MSISHSCRVASCRRLWPSLVAVVGLGVTGLATAGAAQVKVVPDGGVVSFSKAELRDRIRGGWAGQMIGVSYGAPTEFRHLGRINTQPLRWRPDMIDNTLHQDDLYVEMTFAKVMDELGLGACTADYGEAFRRSRYRLWHANAGARRVLNQGIQAPASGRPEFNVHADDIDFQIEADFIGLMCPGLPRESNRFCDRVGRVMNSGDGLYGGMFVCGMYAAGYVEDDPREVVLAGLACIPPRSDYAAVIRDTLRWSALNPEDWRVVWRQLKDKWDRNDACPDGALSAFNIDAKLNGAFIALGLLYGGGDFEKTMEISTRCGQDSDCNPSNAAGILGVMRGYEAIPAKFKANLPQLEDKQFDFTDYSFNDIVASTERRALKLIAANGGKVTAKQVQVKTQTPAPPPLEQWHPGHAVAFLTGAESAWSWGSGWEVANGARRSNQGGAEAEVEFDGTGVVLVGRLDQAGGRATVWLDGQRQARPLDAYIVPNTNDNALWHRFGLKSGHHTLRLQTTGQSDPRSRGTRVTIKGALIYQGAD